MSIDERLERIERLTLLQAKEALNMEDAAAYTGLSKDHLYRLVSKKRIPYYKSEGGKLTYFSKTELCAWLLKHRVSTIEIIKLLNIAHPQSAIRNLREEGHPIAGIWYKRAGGTRYKKYSYDYNRAGQLPVH